MKSIYLLIPLILTQLNFTSNAQTLNVVYEEKRLDKVYSNVLSIYDTISVWKGNNDDENNNSYKDLFIIKNKKSNFIYCNDILFGKTIYIKDSLSTIDWKITNDTIHILTYPCLSAKTYFRGRDYIAYFTTEIQHSDGPWKFSGLPGLILNIKSEDGEYEWSATKIESKLSKDLKQIAIPNEDYLTWNKFQKEFIDTIEKLIKKIKSTISADDKGNIKIDAPEIIYAKVQIGKGLEY